MTEKKHGIDLRKPSAPWQPPAPPVVRAPCPGCQDTGRIATLAGIGPCDLCSEQRAINDAVASRAVMDATEKRLSEAAAAKIAAKVASAAAKMPTSEEVMKDYAPMVAKLNEFYAPNPFVKPVITEAQRDCEECGGHGVVMGDGQEEPCPNCSSLPCPPMCSFCNDSGEPCSCNGGRQPEIMSTVDEKPAFRPATASIPGKRCSVCKGMVWVATSGYTCALGHGGAEEDIDDSSHEERVLQAIGGALPSVLPPARVLDISAALYHTDPIDPQTPSLSNSIASTIVIDCAYEAWLAHPRLGNVPRPPTKSMDAGTIMHALVLEAGRGIKPLPFDNWRTKASQEARDEARADGLLPMLEREYEPLRATAEDIRFTLEDIGLGLRGRSETVVAWHEESRRHGAVLCRAMMDHLIIDEHTGLIIDLKMISSADMKTCINHIWTLGYDCQSACYTSAIEKLYPHLAGRVKFKFAFCQIMRPGSPRRALITPVELNGEFQVLGRERWARAVDTWAQCLKSDQWPGYVPDGHVQRVAPASWMLTGEMDQQCARATDEDEDEAEES